MPVAIDPSIVRAMIQRVALPPEVVTAVAQGRARLLEDAKLDLMKLCKVPGLGSQIITITGPDCVALYARNMNTPFRKGMVEQFRFWTSHQRNDLADAYVVPMAGMISSQTGMSLAEATSIVSQSRDTAGFVGIARPAGPSFPGAGIPMTPLPQVVTEDDAALFTDEEEEEMILQLDNQAATSCGFLREVDPAGGCKISNTGWLVIGGGALAIAGGAFLIMRRKR